MARLAVTAGPDQGRVFKIGASAVIGRAQEGGPGLTDPRVEPRHLVLKQIEGEYYLARGDARSAVVLNGRPVERARLHDGDEIGIGRTILRFEGDGGVAAAPAPAPAPTTVKGATASAIQRAQQVFTNADEVLASFAGRVASGQQTRLETIYRVSNAIGAIAGHDELLEKLLEIIFDQVSAQRGFVLQEQAPGKGLQVVSARDRRLGRLENPPPFSTSIINQVLERREAVLCMDASQDARFSMGQSVAKLSLRSVMAVPLVAEDRILGVIQVDSSVASKAFTQEDLEMLNGIALQASIALERFRLQQEAVEKQRMEAEMKQAGEVQMFLLPKRLPALAGLSFGFSYSLSQGLGGDYFDFVQVDADRLAMVVADVSGHNISAALVMGMCRSVIRQLVSTGQPPATVMAEANRLIEADTLPGMFVTAFLAVIDLSNFQCTYCNAGHNYPLLFRGGAGTPQPLRTGGLALGMMPRSRYKQELLHLGPRDLLALYTDGIVEARNPAGEMLGEEGFIAILQGLLGRESQELAAETINGLQRFTAGEPVEDDVTLIVCQVDDRYGYDRFDLAPAEAHVLPAITRVIEFARRQGFGAAAERMGKALAAALENAIRHGSQGEVGGSVGVRAKAGRQRMTVTIEDAGGGFDHRVQRRRSKGQGIKTMIEAAGRVTWNDLGNVVTLDFEAG